MAPRRYLSRRRQRGTFALMAVVFLLVVVAYGVNLLLDQSKTATYDAMIANQDLQALLLADSATERAVAQLRMSTPSSANGLLRTEDCALFASGSHNLGAGQYQFLSATPYPDSCSTTSTTNGCQSCYITLKGTVGAASRTVAFNVAYDKGDGVTGFGTTEKLKFTLSSSLPSLALQNLAWRVQMKKGSASDLVTATATSGTQLWNLSSPANQSLLGTLASTLGGNAGDYTFQDTLSAPRSYVAVAALLDQNCGAPAYTFATTTESWTAAGTSTLAWQSGGYARLTVAAAPQHGMSSPALSFSGYDCPSVTIKLRRPNVSAGGWYGALQWKTCNPASSCEYTAANMVRVAQPASWGTVSAPITNTLQFNLAGRPNWSQNTITGIRFLPGTVANDTFDVDSIEIAPFGYAGQFSAVSNGAPRTAASSTIGTSSGNKDQVSNGLNAGWCPVESNLLAFAYSEYSSGATLPNTSGAKLLFGATAASATFAAPAGNLQLKRVTGRASYDGTLGSEIYTGGGQPWSISPAYSSGTTVYVPEGILNPTLPSGAVSPVKVGAAVRVTAGTGAFAANSYITAVSTKSFTVSATPSTALGYQVALTATANGNVITASTTDVAKVNLNDLIAVGGTGASSATFPAGTYVMSKPSTTTFVVSNKPSASLASGVTLIGSSFTAGNPYGAPLTPYAFTGNSTSSGSTITASSTDVGRVRVGDLVVVRSGTGSFANGTYVVSKPTPTTFTVSAAPATALSGTNVIVGGGGPGGGTTVESALWMYFVSGNNNTPYKLVSSSSLTAPDQWVGGFACFKGVNYCDQGVTLNTDGTAKSCNVAGLAVRPTAWLEDF